MKITPISITTIIPEGMAEVIPGTKLLEAILAHEAEDTDMMAEFAGRGCYKSWNRPNPATATTETYVGHVQEIRHPNVFEHAMVGFYVQGVSRSLLLELERHRFLSFSVESQRYVDQVKSHGDTPVIPPVIRDNFPGLAARLRADYVEDLHEYEYAMEVMTAAGVDRKTARGAARAFLPESTPTDFTMTANLRCWRDVIGLRIAPNADAEIREFAAVVLSHLRHLAPYSVQDIKN